MGGDGQRSTTATGRAIFADCVRSVDPALCARIEHTSDWRNAYLRPVRDIVLAAAASTDAAQTVSSAGLESAHRRFTFVRGDQELALGAALERYRTPGLASVEVRGRQPREAELTLPYKGRRLFGSDLRRQIDAWVTAGIAEPGFAAALHLLLDNPDWLDLHDVDLAIIGAGAEMGPTRSLLRWGARVHAVDLPRPELWTKLIGIARSTAGALRIPIALDADGVPPFVVGGQVHPEDDPVVAAAAGTDILRYLPETRTWIGEIEQPFVLGTYAYADGATHALLSMACDALAADLTASRDDITLAFLATPTDAFMVPMSAVQESRRRWQSRGLSSLLQNPLRLLGQFEPNYAESYRTAAGQEFGINDSLVPQQGPNYVLAKRIQRWRAIVARASGTPVSANIAPATRTASVVRNRALAAAYAGAGRFGVEVFEPATSTTLMAALLVHDLRNPAAAANPATSRRGPWGCAGRWRGSRPPPITVACGALPTSRAVSWA